MPEEALAAGIITKQDKRNNRKTATTSDQNVIEITVTGAPRPYENWTQQRCRDLGARAVQPEVKARALLRKPAQPTTNTVRLRTPLKNIRPHIKAFANKEIQRTDQINGEGLGNLVFLS